MRRHAVLCNKGGLVTSEIVPREQNEARSIQLEAAFACPRNAFRSPRPLRWPVGRSLDMELL